MRQIVVRRAESAWALQTGAETRYFRSGAQAERSARDLAAGMAARGVPAEVAVFDLSGRPVGRVTYPAAA
ncbi:hypothetical protein [Phenylobacterium sp. J367]|uniref:hypothetical protein n=1 Tax=Phenylobacterium sp. J367 TaxID=2898435 RepID=UPI0021507A9B|nr:hypothetical protein [Phenylobacterium sp. J367]MCR5881102.1 hypothetical protein [Phenylobacterium sp. J367]